MIKNKIKVQFFQSQIEYLALFRDVIQGIKTLIRQIMTFTDIAPQCKFINQINSELYQQIQTLKTTIKQIKKQSNATYDENKIEESVLFSSHQKKIEQLNNKLIIAENQVQELQTIKKQKNANKYQLPTEFYKNFRKINDAEIINKFISSQIRIIEQFMRSMQLLITVTQQHTKSQLNYKHHQKQLKLLKMRQYKIPYQCMRKMQLFDQEKKSKSQQKYRCYKTDYNCLKKTLKHPQKQPLILLLLRSPFITYKSYRQVAQKTLLHRIRSKNQQYTITSNHLSSSLEEKRKQQVLKYLEIKQQLNQEESLMKIQLIANKLRNHIDQRLLSLKYNKSQQELSERNTSITMPSFDNVVIVNRRQTKSQNKTKKKKEKCHQKQNCFEKLTFVKQSQSNPKTNDSLTNAHFGHGSY